MYYLGLDEDQCRRLIEAATGIDMGDYKGLMRTGERILNLERLFNLKEVSRKRMIPYQRECWKNLCLRAQLKEW
jgi:aldehyde:ferredoxin oxidoreductase